MDKTIYHVLLEGRKVGPYDRRTIVGMRIKKTLTSEHVLIGIDGSQLTVAELIGQRPDKPFSSDRSGSFSVVRATFAASLLEVEGKGAAIPAFKGEVEARVQPGVLRIAGRFRHGLRWREDRVKLPLKDVMHARVNNSQVDLWLRAPESRPLQRVSLELFTPESAGELVDWLPDAKPWPGPAPAAAAGPRSDGRILWLAGAGLGGIVVVLVVLVAVALLHRRLA